MIGNRNYLAYMRNARGKQHNGRNMSWRSNLVRDASVERGSGSRGDKWELGRPFIRTVGDLQSSLGDLR